jgi:hypothetical protein
MKKMILAGVLFFITHQLLAQTTDQPSASTDSSKAVIDSTELYGFIPQRPIKVGGGPADQRNYLESLRDAQGKKVTYERLASCCPFPSSSPKALFGSGMLDIYIISYRDANNKKKNVSVYISFYDYERPKAIKGFTMK